MQPPNLYKTKTGHRHSKRNTEQLSSTCNIFNIQCYLETIVNTNRVVGSKREILHVFSQFPRIVTSYT